LERGIFCSSPAEYIQLFRLDFPQSSSVPNMAANHLPSQCGAYIGDTYCRDKPFFYYPCMANSFLLDTFRVSNQCTIMAFSPSANAQQGAALLSHLHGRPGVRCQQGRQLGHRHCTTGQDEQEKENERTMSRTVQVS
jgi:hypothetical protein